MRIVLQRVSGASVRVGGALVSQIGPGLLLLVGVGKQDGKRFFASVEPCALRRYSSRRDLSCSLNESLGCFFSTPAARSCSSRTEGGTFSSLANWATLV